MTREDIAILWALLVAILSAQIVQVIIATMNFTREIIKAFQQHDKDKDAS